MHTDPMSLAIATTIDVSLAVVSPRVSSLLASS
jgi:hypothetical protein